MAPMLGLSCTFMACVFDRPGWKLYSKPPCHGPLVGLCWVTWWRLCWAKRCRHLGLCSANFNPDLRKITSGLGKTVLFGPCPNNIGPILCQVGGMLGLSCSNWILLQNFCYIKGRTWATVQIASQGSFCTKQWSWDHLFVFAFIL